jgi:signal peptidase I
MFQSLLTNFALILLILTVVTGIIWTLDLFVLSKRREAAERHWLSTISAKQSLQLTVFVWIRISARKLLQPSASASLDRVFRQFFPVILLVFVLRSFLFEPFKIPSGSMLPTLFVGDLILVNKFTYGIRLPVINKKVIEIGQPQRGDVMVFKYPMDPQVDYIKRVVGVPGDKVEYKNKRLTINGTPASYEPLQDFLGDNNLEYSRQFRENLLGVQHRILNNDDAPVWVEKPMKFPGRENCVYDNEGFTCVVPQGSIL